MDIEFVAFAKLDYYELSKIEEVYDALETIYDDEGEQYSGPTFSGSWWSQRVFGNYEDNPLETDEDIRWIRTIVENNVRGVLDIATIGLLSQKKIDDIFQEDEYPRNEYEQFKSKLNNLISDIPSVVNDDILKSYITYIEPGQEFDFHSGGQFDIERIQEIIEENADTLSRFDYLVGGYHTLFQGNHVLTQCVSTDPYSRLSIFTRGLDSDHIAPDELHTRPVWYRNIVGLTSYFRAYYWSKYRRQQINEFDTRINKNRDDWIGSLDEIQGTDVLLESAQEIHDLQLSWVDIFTNVVDETDHLQFLFQPIEEKGNDDVERFWPEPIEIPPLDSNVISSRPEGERDLFSIYQNDVWNRLELLRSEVERVDDKVRKLSSNLHDVITVESTAETISLQKWLKYLTGALVFLTIVVIVLEIINYLA